MYLSSHHGWLPSLTLLNAVHSIGQLGWEWRHQLSPNASAHIQFFDSGLLPEAEFWWRLNLGHLELWNRQLVLVTCWRGAFEIPTLPTYHIKPSTSTPFSKMGKPLTTRQSQWSKNKATPEACKKACEEHKLHDLEAQADMDSIIMENDAKIHAYAERYNKKIAKVYDYFYSHDQACLLQSCQNPWNAFVSNYCHEHT